MTIASDIFDGSGGYGRKRNWDIHPDAKVIRRWGNKYENRHTFSDDSVLIFSLYPSFLISHSMDKKKPAHLRTHWTHRGRS